MGLETALLVGGLALGGYGMASSYQNSQNQAKALKSEAALKASERAKEATALAAEQKVSFLNSGIALTGEENSTPTSVMSSTYAKGKEDINQIKENYNAKLESVYSSQRSNFLSGLGMMALGTAASGLLSGISLGGSTAVTGGVGGSTGVASVAGKGVVNTWSPSASQLALLA